MAKHKTNFKDALDYIFVANDSGPNTYLISAANASATTSASFPDMASHRVTNAISATAASAASAVTASIGAITAAATTAATAVMLAEASAAASTSDAAASAVTAASSSAASSSAAAALISSENLYSGVAVGLGAMLINDSLLAAADMNGTSFFGDIVNGSDLMGNGSAGNATSIDDDLAEFLQMAATSVVLGLMILITIIGNVFVIAAIILERNLQNVANYLVASLAVADLFVACLVMPLGAVYEISQGWILGPELCDIWTSCDVLCCTASILHLVAIAVDRYWAVTNIDYIHSRTSRRVFMMIFCVWSASVIVSLAPQFGWKDPDYLQRIEQQKCMVSQDVGYQVFATCCTFYVPLLVILVIYWKIYQTAKKRIHRRRPRPIDVTGNNNQPDLSGQKKRKRLRLRIGKFSGEKGGGSGGGGATGTGTTLGLVEGNSTNTVNTVEDTEFSSSNVDSKSRAGVEVPTTSTSQISTVSHLVALANQQHATSTSAPATAATTLKSHQKDSTSTTTTQSAADAITATTARTTQEEQTIATAASASKVCIVTPNESHNGGPNATTTTPTDIVNGGAGNSNGNGVEVLEDPQLQQQLEQVQQQTAGGGGSTTATAPTKCPTSGGGGGASTSNATTITSISALSPQTPTTPALGGAAPATPTCISSALPANFALQQQQHPLSNSANASSQVTPIPKPKNQQQQQQQQQQLASISNPMHKVTKRKETLEAKRERKAAKTLAIITGAFVVCWLPFFVMALMLPLCESCQINDGVASLFLWLGYFNSTLNPVIYTIFSPEFRQAFKRILFGGHRPVHYRSGKI